jgi:hypothetical protein
LKGLPKNSSALALLVLFWSLTSGGYGVYFFSQLKGKADFVTWAKYLKKDDLKDLEYTSCIKFQEKKYLIAEKKKLIRESSSTAQKEGRKEITSLPVRMVVFQEIDANKTPIAIYTSDQKRPAPYIAYYMLSLWGESENFFKEIMACYNFNYHLRLRYRSIRRATPGG